jgi:hypothetical protein
VSRSVRFFVFVFLILTTAGRAAAAQSNDKTAVPAKEVPRDAPAPAATARAVAKALTDAQARRKDPRPPQRDRPVIPAEQRWQLVWPVPEERIALAWPASPRP